MNLNLYPSHEAAAAALQSSRTIRVIDTRSGASRCYWACPAQAETAMLSGDTSIRLHRNRVGVVIGAMLVHVEEPSTARYISASAAGASRVQPLQNGYSCYALTNAKGAVIGG